MSIILRRQEDVIGLPGLMQAQEDKKLLVIAATTDFANDVNTDIAAAYRVLVDEYTVKGNFAYKHTEIDALNSEEAGNTTSVEAKVASYQAVHDAECQELFTNTYAPKKAELEAQLAKVTGDATVAGSIAKMYQDFINDADATLTVKKIADKVLSSETIKTTLTDLSAVSAENLKSTIRDGAAEAYDTYAEVLVLVNAKIKEVKDAIHSSAIVAITEGENDPRRLAIAHLGNRGFVLTADQKANFVAGYDLAIVPAADATNSGVINDTITPDVDGKFSIAGFVPADNSSDGYCNMMKASFIRNGAVYDIPFTVISTTDGELNFQLITSVDFSAISGLVQRLGV